MEELFRRLFGITGGIQDQSVAQAFPIGQGQVDIQPISAGDMPIAQPVVPQVVPQGFSASQFLPSMDAMRNALPSMENLRGIIPTFAGLEGRINEAITPQLPAYMQGLLGTEVEAQLPEQARRAGLLNAAAALMQASGPQDRRISLGQALGAGLQGYQQGSQGAFDQTLQGLKLRSELSGGKNLTDDIKEYQYAVSNGGFKGTFSDWQTKKPMPSTNVYVNTEQTYGGQLAKGVGDEDLALRKVAENAPSALQTINTSRRLVDEGKIFTGKGANVKLEFAKFGQALGITGANTDEIIANTTELMKNRARSTLDNVKASGLGSGQGFTDRDREFLEKAVLGNITYDAASLRRQLDIEERIARGAVQKWNNRLQQIPKSATTPLGLGPVKIPLPQGVSGVREAK